jgi:hypothetical protein
VTSRLTEEQQVARESFARENAVYLGLAHTADAVVDAAAELLGAPPEASSDGDVVVMDAVARLYRLLETDRADARWKELCGRPVVDPDGDEAANVVEFIAESVPADGSQAPIDEIRYVIVAYGGVLGIGRRQTVLPINQVDLDSNPARVSVSKETLHRAPHYDHTAPFSRREEHAICAYFGTTPYWSDATSP